MQLEFISIILSMLIILTSAELKFKSCSQQNEICVDIKSCYFNDANFNSFSWMKRNWKSLKTSLCNADKDSWSLSICCRTELNAEDCGISEGDRMAYGNVVQPYQFPWMVLLRNQFDMFVCGGTLITRWFVLSAAHCKSRENIVSVRVGENDITQEVDCRVWNKDKDCAPLPQDIEVDQLKSIIHPEYSNRYKTSDIALFKLVKAAELGFSVRPVCLPIGIPNPTIPVRLYIAGWGVNEKGTAFDVLRHGSVDHLPLEKCVPGIQNLLSRKNLNLDQHIHICTQGGKNKTNTCEGDSGGPLLTDNILEHSQFVQYGVVSVGANTCGDKNNPTLYTNVLPYLGWILATVAGNK